MPLLTLNAESGDSGSPVYTVPDANGNVHIVGIIWAVGWSPELGNITSFHSWDRVVEEYELKPIQP